MSKEKLLNEMHTTIFVNVDLTTKIKNNNNNNYLFSIIHSDFNIRLILSIQTIWTCTFIPTC